MIEWIQREKRGRERDRACIAIGLSRNATWINWLNWVASSLRLFRLVTTFSSSANWTDIYDALYVYSIIYNNIHMCWRVHHLYMDYRITSLFIRFQTNEHRLYGTTICSIRGVSGQVIGTELLWSFSSRWTHQEDELKNAHAKKVHPTPVIETVCPSTAMHDGIKFNQISL